MPLPDRTLAWHDALSESVWHDQTCDFCVQDILDGVIRCAEGQRFYAAEQAAWREHKADQMLGVC